MSDLLPPLLPRSPHGGPSSTAFSGLDFSVNSNPYGPNPVLLEAVRNADHAHYPDPAYLDVRQALADWHGVSPDMVALSVGASDLLHRLARAFLPAGSKLLSLHAPFGELERAARLQRAEVVVVGELPAALLTQTRLVYVGQPHNPTGRCLSEGERQTVADACAAAGALLVLDLAYAPFTEVSINYQPSTIALHSPGKAHGLVGARPAYAIAAPEVVARLENLAPAWHLPAGTAALLQKLPHAQEFLAHTLPQVRRDALALAAALARFGAVEHHGTPYMTLEVGDGARVPRELLALGIKVRDCTSYSLPGHIRVSTQGGTRDARLIAALQEVRDG
ncbi:histidinol-phosphate aminotransferase [Deinococcus piscis]|uniref:Histidinol-phosphate aminotransferase n=1 Tax=Deinococcus piscis TaxID=394230 RepID=A0ABQ3K4D0_9DEIO|nr:aminotransferase class I/II-fold pyridoxal phosphate-dependent enzyme [Deinococcus piscis]GHG02977.1 histidinol-phosphate aminotransferase [Deinococcus piscis]